MTSDRERLRRLAEFLDSTAEEGAQEGMADPQAAGGDLQLDADRVYEKAIAAVRAARDREPRPAAGGFRRWLSTANRFRVSLALNGVLVAWIITAASPFNPFARFTPRLEVSEHEIVVHDAARGKVVWSHVFGGLVRIAKVAPWNGGTTFLVVGELDGVAGEGRIRCFDFQHDREVWQRHLARDEVAEFFGHERLDAGSFRCETVDFVDLRGDGDPEVMVTYLHQVFLPCAVRTYDKSGEVLGTYLHWGLLAATAVTDLDGDGKQELVIGGTDNAPAIQAAAVVVLDGDHLDGASVDRFVQRDGYHDGSRYRLLLPRFAPDVMAGLDLVRLHVIKVRPDHDHSGNPVLRLIVGLEHDQVTVVTDSQLRVTDAILHDSFAQHLRTLRDEGRITTDLTDSAVLQQWVGGRYRFVEGQQVEPLDPPPPQRS